MMRLTDKGKLERGTFVGEWFNDCGKEMKEVVGLSKAKQIYLKLKRLEDIEDAFDIPVQADLSLADLLEARLFYRTLYYKLEDKVVSCYIVDFHFELPEDYYSARTVWVKLSLNVGPTHRSLFTVEVRISEYGKSWSFKKEDLEDGK